MMAFMTPETSSVGGKVFADSAYFSEILNKKQAMEDQLKSLFAASAKKGDAALANRLMYGTDWEMVIIEGQATTQYLKLFEDVFADLRAGEQGDGPEGGPGEFFALDHWKIPWAAASTRPA